MSDKPPRLRFRLTTVLWAVTAAAIALGWAVDHWRLRNEVTNLQIDAKYLEAKLLVAETDLKLLRPLLQGK